MLFLLDSRDSLVSLYLSELDSVGHTLTRHERLRCKIIAVANIEVTRDVFVEFPSIRPLTDEPLSNVNQNKSASLPMHYTFQALPVDQSFLARILD